jgi:alanine racemase
MHARGATVLPRVLRPKRALLNEAVRSTRAVINLANLRHNLRVIQRAAKSPVWAVLITVDEIATHVGSIPWEVLTSVSRRVPRFYREP